MSKKIFGRLTQKHAPVIWERVGSSVTLVAQTVGFEPTVLFTVQTISSRSRYDHFDTSANYIKTTPDCQ